MNRQSKKRKGINYSKLRCPYCGSSVIYRSADGIYKDNPRRTMLYVCSRYPACDSYVRVHAGTKIPVGELANQPLRTLRRQAHHYFDQVYLSGLMSKQEAYLWLAQITCTPQSRAHIACMGEYNCRIIIEESRRLLEQQAIPYVALPELEVSQIET